MTVEPISCAFDHLYPSGAGFPEPDLLGARSRVSQSADAHGIDAIGELFPAQDYGKPFDPAIFVRRTEETDAMAPLYRGIAVKAASPVVLVRIARAIVCNSLVYIAGGELRLVYETQRWNDRAATVSPSAQALLAATSFEASPATSYLFLASAGSPNYGHFLVDDLPRLKAIDLMRGLWPSRRYGVVFPSFGGAIDQVRHDAVATLCGPDVEVRFIEANRTYSINNLFYASPCSLHPTVKNPLAMDHVRSSAHAVVDDVDAEPRRLFIDRSARESRQLLNGDAVAKLLQTYGYRQIYPERMTFRDQLRMFASADRVVGQMGAAMTNTLFCDKHSEMLYLAPQGWTEPFYWDLAMALDQRYRVLYGAVSVNDESPAHLKDCKVDLDDLTNYLDG